MAESPKRAIWNGHISFGLVNVPVALYSAERRQDIQLHLLDSRDFRRVRYERVNAETGEEVPWDQIVKGFEYDNGQYVLLSEEELESAAGRVSKTIEIEDFVTLEAIDPIYFDKPYYLEPRKGGHKSYALLREALRQSGKVAVAEVAIRSREHLACLLVREDCLVLELMRFPQEIRAMEGLDLPSAENGGISISKREVDMALQLIESMTAEWSADRYHDDYRENLLRFIEDKVSRKEFSAAAAPPDPEEEPPGDVVDLMDYLRKSLGQVQEKRGSGGSGKAAAKKAARKAPAKKVARKASSKRSA